MPIPRSSSRTLVVLAALLAVALLPAPVRADFCGDGVADPFEECDDGNFVDDDGCSAGCDLEPCPPAPVPACVVAARAQLQVNEKKAGRERLLLQWAKASAATTLADFGDVTTFPSPATAARRVLACLYDDGGVLLRELRVARSGQTSCPSNRNVCWRQSGTGYAYEDLTGFEDGVRGIKFAAGPAGRGKASVRAANGVGHAHMDVGLAAALAGNDSPTIQLITSAGFCLGATMNKVTADGGAVYKARKK